MNITMQKLIELDADIDLLVAYEEHMGGFEVEGEVPASSLVGGDIAMIDLIWIASKLGSKQQLMQFACNAVLLKFENIKPHCGDYTYHSIKNFLENPSTGSCHSMGKRAARHLRHIDIFNYDWQVSDIANCVRSLFTAIECKGEGLAGLAGGAYHVASIISKQVPKEEIDQLLIELLS